MIYDAESLLTAEEGRRNFVYPDQFGYPTAGIGHKDSAMHIGDAVSDEQVDAWFASDFTTASTAIAARWPPFASLDPVRQAYVVSMAFQLGVNGALAFHHTLGCLAAADWQGAHDGALASAWHQQTPARSERAANAFLSGEWQQIP